MQWTAWIGMLLTSTALAAGLSGPPPVVLELGPVRPTPVPTFKPADKKRLVTTITVQNGADGDSRVTFEVTDVADEGAEKVRTVASKRYALSDENPALQALTARIVEHVRLLERDMLDYAEKAGPPKERPPIGSGTRGGGASR